MKVIRQDHGEIVVLAIKGRLDQSSADSLHISAMEALEEGKMGLIINMEGVDFIASVGIRALIRPAQSISLRGGKLVVANLKPELREFFALTGLDQMFTIHEDVEAAQAALGG